jgi:hypothetical protein
MYFLVKKLITLKSENKKQCCIKCWKCPQRSAMHAFTLFLMLDATRRRVSAATFEMNSSIFCFNSSNVCGLFLYTFSFKKPQRQKSGGNRSGDREGHKLREIMRPQKNSLNICIVEFAVCAVAPSCWNQQSCSSTSQKENEIHNQFLVTFSCYRFTEENGTNYHPSRDSTPYSDFQAVWRSFIDGMWIFITPYSAVLAVNVSI